MNKKILVLIPVTCMLFSCNKSIKINWPWKSKKDNQTSQQQTQPTQQIDNVEPVETTTHATSVTADPNASFYLKVGETKELKMSLSPSPTLASEKTFTWKTNNNSIRIEVDSKDSKKATVTALKAGEAVVTATNDYNNTLEKTFKIKCLDYNPDNVYLWQYKSEDRAQFGYNYSTSKEGTPTGVAVLNGKEWSYTRSTASSLQTSHGAIGFGKGDSPETLVHLETESNRIVKQIVIETASANSLAKLTAKVGDTVILNDVEVDRITYDEISTIKSDLCNAEGKISLDFVTPEYDSSRAEDPNYKAPGAVYLKSILIYYAEENVDHLEVGALSRHQIDWTEGDVFSTVGLAIDKVTVRGTHLPINVEQEIKDKKLVVIEPNMSEPSHESQKVYLKYTIEGYDEPFQLTYDIHVRGNDWIPEKIEISGTINEQHLIAGDDVDYSDLSIKVIYDNAQNDFSVYPFEDNGIFSFTYGYDEADPFLAEAVMSSGFNLYVSATYGKTSPTLVSGTYKVNSGILFVQDAVYDKIDFRKESLVDSLNINGEYKDVTYVTPNERLTLHFDGVKKDGRYDNNNIKVPATNKNFQLIVNDKTCSIDSVNIQFANTASKSNDYRLCESVFGGTIYGDPIVQAEYNKIVAKNLISVTNAVELIPGLTSKNTLVTTCTGVLSILVRYNENPHVAYELSTGETSPIKKAYNEGDLFDPTGVAVTLTSEYENTSLDVTEYIKWYDGATYNTSKQQTLTPESKLVVGEFNDKTIEVAIESVTEQKLNLSLVKNVSEINDEGQYFLVNRNSNLICLGSAKNFQSGTGSATPGATQIEGVNFGDTVTLNILYKMDYFNIIKEEGKNSYLIQGTNGHGWSVSKGGGSSSALSPDNGLNSFTLEIDPNTGIALFRITGTTGTGVKVDKYLGSTETKFDLYDVGGKNTDEKLCVSIYKVN